MDRKYIAHPVFYILFTKISQFVLWTNEVVYVLITIHVIIINN
jgi:hypothetical protein